MGSSFRSLAGIRKRDMRMICDMSNVPSCDYHRVVVASCMYCKYLYDDLFICILIYKALYI